jgi:hypothetical protein
MVCIELNDFECNKGKILKSMSKRERTRESLVLVGEGKGPRDLGRRLEE